MTASAAGELDETVLQNPASQIRIELFLDELRQAVLRFCASARSRDRGQCSLTSACRSVSSGRRGA
jgi:hypothetical protein